LCYRLPMGFSTFLAPRVSRSAFSFRTLVALAPLPIFLSGCVVSCNDQDGDFTECDNGNCYVGGGFASDGGANSGGSSVGGAAPVCDPSLTVCACSESSECSAGLDCIDGKCVSACGFDFECADAEVCADGQCVAACDEGECASNYECVGGACLPDTSNPECTTPTDCQGLPCIDGFCTTACITNADCPEDFLCAAATGTCFQDLGPTPVCSDDVPCAGEGQACTDGFCRYSCATLEECKLIDSRFDACDASVCKTDDEVNPECGLGLPCDPAAPCVSNECVQPL
jgi:hypothetical protein